MRLGNLTTGWGQRQVAVAACLSLVLLVGAALRIDGANWDEGAHLHPDERYISSVANVIRWPDSVGGYFDASGSTLSPYTTSEGRSYSYGTLPLFATKLVATMVGDDDYDHLYLVGRRLSALVDTLTILLVFLIARTILARATVRERDVGSLFAAGLYAVTVAAIQASHFFTTDTWLTMLGTATFWLALVAVARARETLLREFAPVALAGVGTGLTVACKASGGFVLVPVLVALAGRTVLVKREGAREAGIRLGRDLLAVGVGAYAAFRAVSPYSFAHSSWLEFGVSKPYSKALAEQRDILDGHVLFPPTLQWLLSPRVTDPVANLVTWQLGPALGMAAILGLGVLVVRAARTIAAARSAASSLSDDRIIELTSQAMLLAFVAVVVLYMTTRFQHMGRYLLPVMALLAVAAGAGCVAALRRRQRATLAAAAAVLGITLLYAVAFTTIYRSPMTRLEASRWIVANVPTGAAIAAEHWDDSLPVGALAQGYRFVTVPVFEPDDDTKLRELYDPLRDADYYAVTSQRAWGTVGRLPDRYPLMARYYDDLFAGRLGFARVASFSSVPRLFGVELDDSGAEEAFSVYDHPPVSIFRRVEPPDFDRFRAELCRPPAPTACG
jgi:hypothetical protein